MATGSGKTICALHAADLAPKSMLTIVCVPTIPLVAQWEYEIHNFDKSAAIILAGTSKSNWNELLGPKLAPYRLHSDLTNIDKRTFIICTNTTASDLTFVNMWEGIPSENIQLISDEVHHLGADFFQNIFKINASRRLGLSATPERQWDDEGNQTVLNYFKKTVYEYDIKRAITDGYLAHYTYHPLFASMSEEEFREYYALTVEIGREVAIHNQKEKQFGSWLPISDYHKQLLEKRALIKKKTQDKISVFREWCQKITQSQILVFCEDTEQMNELIEILNMTGKKYAIYKSDMTDSQKTSSLKLFKENLIELILAIRCLDEGLDVPDCSACVIVSSSTSVREFVQRRGRVLRAARPDKIANVYDLLVLPPVDFLPEQEKAAHTMVESELERVKIMIDSADNKLDIIGELRQKLQYYDPRISEKV
jgi:superfamily II DNA or RNA helicase